MLICAFDVRRTRIHVVLAGDYGFRTVLATASFRRTESSPALRQLECWREQYDEGDLVLVGCPQDDWPTSWFEVFAGTRLPFRWIDRDEITAMQAAWRRLNSARREWRGCLMAFRVTASAHSCANVQCPAAAIETVEALLADRILEQLSRLPCSAKCSADGAVQLAAMDATGEIPF